MDRTSRDWKRPHSTNTPEQKKPFWVHRIQTLHKIWSKQIKFPQNFLSYQLYLKTVVKEEKSRLFIQFHNSHSLKFNHSVINSRVIWFLDVCVDKKEILKIHVATLCVSYLHYLFGNKDSVVKTPAILSSKLL